MSLEHSPHIVLDGLITHYDFNNPKSWTGGSLGQNLHVLATNPRLDKSYSPYVYTASGTWATRHPDAIQVFSVYNGADISSYTNTGVGDWTNTCHAIWTYDKVLNKPVTTMRSSDNQWMAKTFGHSITMASIGLTTGSKYTLSWLQWTDNLSRGAYAGLYSQGTNAVWNFHDGISFGYNTKLRTWQRVWVTYTVGANTDLNTVTGSSWYMYGYNNGTGVIKVSDVQFDPTPYPRPYIETTSRASTECLKDLMGNFTTSVASLAYDTSGAPTFNGTNSQISTAITGTYSAFSISVWGYSETTDTTLRNESIYGDWTSGNIHFGTKWSVGMHLNINNIWEVTPNTNLRVGWNCYTIVYDAVANIKLVYINGILSSTNVAAGAVTFTNFTIGVAYNLGYFYTGKIDSFMMYNKALSNNEVIQNYNAQRGRFGV